MDGCTGACKVARCCGQRWGLAKVSEMRVEMSEWVSGFACVAIAMAIAVRAARARPAAPVRRRVVVFIYALGRALARSPQNIYLLRYWSLKILPPP